MDKQFHSTHFWVSDYLSLLGLKLIHIYIVKGAPGWHAPLMINELSVNYIKWWWPLIIVKIGEAHHGLPQGPNQSLILSQFSVMEAGHGMLQGPHLSTMLSVVSMVNPSTTGNPLRHKVLITIVAADALVLKHQAISSNNTDLIILLSEQFHSKCLLFIWTQLD